MESERDRIENVYGEYYQSDRVRRKWDDANPGNQAMMAERRTALGPVLAPMHAIAHPVVLEIGCGSGTLLADLPQLLPADARVFGTDLLGDLLPLAATRCPVFQCDGQALPLAPHSADAVITATVFSSVLDDHVADRIAAEIDRVLRPGGRLVWYDMRRPNPRNPATRPVGSEQLARLFPGWVQQLTSCTVLPPLARRLGGATDRLYPLLSRLSFLHTHQIGALVKPDR